MSNFNDVIRIARKTAVGDEPQTIYALFSGKHYSTGCCFDYGNAERNHGGLNPGNMEVLEYRRFSSRHLISHSNTASNTVSLSRSRPSPSHLPLPLSIPIAFAFAFAFAFAIVISISISISQFLFLKNEHFWNACATYNEGSLLWLQRHSTAFT